MNFLIKYLILIPIFLSACATSKPEKIPEINSAILPATQIEILMPKTLRLMVTNTRVINQQFGNSPQVEQAVFSAMKDSLSRGGITLDSKSPNSMMITSEDCKEIQKNSECLDLSSQLKTGKYSLQCDGHSSATMRKGNSTYNSFAGDVNDVFQSALNTIINCYNKNSSPEAFKK